MPPPHLISIHAPREGSDEEELRQYLIDALFQSTLPARGATLCGTECLIKAVNFNPRSPRGERHGLGCLGDSNGEFQSTLPARGATEDVRGDPSFSFISIHAPREGSDQLRPITGIMGGISIHAPREGSDRAGAATG